MKFVSFRVRTAVIVHGYSNENREIAEKVPDESFVE